MLAGRLRSISVSGSAFIHVTDAADTSALSGVILGLWPGLGVTVFSWRNFCISVIDETLTPTGGMTCSALDGVVDRHLLRPRLTSARPSRRLSTIGSTMASVQISQGNSRDLPAYACRIYVAAFRASIGLWRLWPPHPAAPPHPLPVRQASILPRASFRFAVTRDTLASG